MSLIFSDKVKTEVSERNLITILDVKNWREKLEAGRISNNDYIRKVIFDIRGLGIHDIEEHFTYGDIYYGECKGPVFKLNDNYYWILVSPEGDTYSYHSQGAVPTDL